MTRLIKLLFNLLLAIVAVAVTLAVLFFLNPSWQKALVQDTLAKDSARRWQLESIRIQPTHVEAGGIYVLDGSMGAEIRIVELQGPLWKLPLTGVLEIESGRLTGLEADLSGVRVGDLTSEDYQSFLERVSGDDEFWKERIGLVLSKFSATGLGVKMREVEIRGRLLMPGDHVIPVQWMIVEADSSAPRLIQIKPLVHSAKLEL